MSAVWAASYRPASPLPGAPQELEGRVQDAINVTRATYTKARATKLRRTRPATEPAK